ncbi:MAG: hypothetical protein WBB37_10750 [bacterium]
MFCPECKAEYVEGIKICPECGVKLVNELNEKESRGEEDFSELIAVLSTYSHGDVAIIKSILDAAGIYYYFKGERHLGLVKPWADPAKLMVKKNEADTVKDLLKDLRLQSGGWFPNKNK